MGARKNSDGTGFPRVVRSHDFSRDAIIDEGRYHWTVMPAPTQHHWATGDFARYYHALTGILGSRQVDESDFGGSMASFGGKVAEHGDTYIARRELLTSGRRKSF